MGYYTLHTLEVRCIKDEDEFKDLVNTMRDYDLIGYAFDEGHFPAYISNMKGKKYSHEAVFCPYDEVKWYSSSEDMTAISEKFPSMYFELSGDGEDMGDYWKEYFHNGNVEYCRGEIVYEQPTMVKWSELRNF